MCEHQNQQNQLNVVGNAGTATSGNMQYVGSWHQGYCPYCNPPRCPCCQRPYWGQSYPYGYPYGTVLCNANAQCGSAAQGTT